MRETYPKRGHCNSSNRKRRLQHFWHSWGNGQSTATTNGVLPKLYVLYNTVKNLSTQRFFHLARFFTITLTYLGNLLYHYYGSYLQLDFLRILSDQCQNTTDVVLQPGTWSRPSIFTSSWEYITKKWGTIRVFILLKVVPRIILTTANQLGM